MIYHETSHVTVKGLTCDPVVSDLMREVVLVFEDTVVIKATVHDELPDSCIALTSEDRDGTMLVRVPLALIDKQFTQDDVEDIWKLQAADDAMLRNAY